MQSTIYTIGTALGRAKDHGVRVSLLVGGQWIEGRVGDVDGHGVVLTDSSEGHAVVRIEAVSAVRIHAEEILEDTTPDPWEAYPAPKPLASA